MLKLKICVVVLLFSCVTVFSQSVQDKLQQAMVRFGEDPQLKHAAFSLYVINAQTGEVVFDKNSQLGLAPASTQKIITTVSAYEILGKDFRYETRLEFVKDKNTIVIRGSGDPSFGSPRWKQTDPSIIFSKWSTALKDKKIKKVERFLVDQTGWQTEIIPDGWIWQDIGNYYGAGADKLNWRENQFDIYMKAGDLPGDEVSLIKTDPVVEGIKFDMLLKTGAKGSGDNAYVYFPFEKNNAVIRGTIPAGEKNFRISAAMPGADKQLVYSIASYLKKQDIDIGKSISTGNEQIGEKNRELIDTYYSPTLDSLVYWFNKKSINLYGEAFVKTFGFQKTGIGSTDSGTAIIRKLWKEKGLDEEELNIYDGSGLSPLNRITTHAQVEILKYAKGRSWFPGFLNALPVYNGMTMKSGTISDVKGFCGYHTSKTGEQFIFSFLVNNYSGKTTPLVNKMYEVLNSLK